MGKILGTLLLFLCTAASADTGRVLSMTDKGRVKLSQPASQPWKVGDFLCLYQAESIVACGVVSSTEASEIELDLDFNKATIEPGLEVRKPPARMRAAPVAIVEGPGVRLFAPESAENFLRAALLWDVSQWFFTGSFERALSNHVSMGVKVDAFDLFDANRKLSGCGILLTRSFFTLPRFRGIGVQVAVGPYFFTGNDGVNQGNGVSFLVDLNAVWRFQLFEGISLGIQTGMRWIPAPYIQNGVNIGAFFPIRGSLGLDLGFVF
jgi:hypothetical protein